MEFIPINICYTLFDDLWVMMVNHDNTESKDVRYSAFKKTQSIPENVKSYSSESLYFLPIVQLNILLRTGIWIFVLLIILQVQ